MSKRRMFEPSQYVPGSSVVLDKTPEGKTHVVTAVEDMFQRFHGDTPYCREGDPMWRKPKPMGFVQHFKNVAMRRKYGNIKDAPPSALKVVAVYQGLPASLATYVRGLQRRVERLGKKRTRMIECYQAKAA